MNEDDLRVKILDERITQLKYLDNHHHFDNVDSSRISDVIGLLILVRDHILSDDNYNHL